MIAKVVFAKPPAGEFDYAVPSGLQVSPGIRVTVPFGSARRRGYVVSVKEKSDAPTSYTLKSVIDVMDERPIIDEKTFGFAASLSRHYFISIGAALNLIYPIGLKYSAPSLKSAPSQSSSLCAAVLRSSDRYEFYKDIISIVLKSQKSVLLVLPEISDVFWAKDYFSVFEPVVWRSDDSNKNQSAVFNEILSRDFSFVIGTRRALLLPINNLHTVIVDREYDYAHKDGRSPYYTSRDIALIKSMHFGIRVIFGGLVFSTGIYSRIKDGSVKNMTPTLPEVYEKNPWTVIKKSEKRKNDILSNLKKYIDKNYARGLATVIHTPRRGYSGGLFCMNCKTILKCADCGVPMVSHMSASCSVLKCHYCGKELPSPPSCNSCKSINVLPLSFGTQKIEAILKENYPRANIVRYDSDSCLSVHEKLNADFIIATHPPRWHKITIPVGLVIVLDADSGFFHPDYSANETVFLKLADYYDLLSDSVEKRDFVVETAFSGYYVFKCAFGEFYDEELKHRREMNYPPFSRLITLTFRDKSEGKVIAAAETALGLMRNVIENKGLDLEVMGPTTDYKSRIKKQHVRKIILKGGSGLDEVISTVKKVKKSTSKIIIEEI